MADIAEMEEAVRSVRRRIRARTGPLNHQVKSALLAELERLASPVLDQPGFREEWPKLSLREARAAAEAGGVVAEELRVGGAPRFELENLVPPTTQASESSRPGLVERVGAMITSVFSSEARLGKGLLKSQPKREGQKKSAKKKARRRVVYQIAFVALVLPLAGNSLFMHVPMMVVCSCCKWGGRLDRGDRLH